MVIGDISSIGLRSNSNKNVFVIAGERTCMDIDKLDELLETLAKQTIISGDCLKLDYILGGSLYHFNVFKENGGVYEMDTSQSLSIDFSQNPEGEINYGSNLREKQASELRRQSRIVKMETILNGLSNK